MESLKNKVVIITDALSSVGSEIAVTLTQSGCSLALCGAQADALSDLAARCIDSQVLTYVTEQSENEISDVVQQTAEKFGRIDALVFTNETHFNTDFEASTVDDLEEAFKVNVEPLLLWYQQTLSHLAKTKGSIIAISSLASKKTTSGHLPYSVSKAALDQLTRCIALESTSYGIRANCINPAALSQTKDASLGDSVTATDVARYISFLLSDAASFTTGCTITL